MKIPNLDPNKSYTYDEVLAYSQAVQAASKPKLYLFQDEATKAIFISAYDPESTNWELNHMAVREVNSNGQVMKTEVSLNILRNVISVTDEIRVELS